MSSINFTGVSAITIPEGSVKKITQQSSGIVLWEKIIGIPLGDLSVGTSVYMNVNGVSTEFIVVQQGLPSSSYDSSCNGTWLLMKDIYESRVWDSSNNDYANSDIHSYLNDTFVNLFDSDINDVIKQVKLPYVNGTGQSGSLDTGANGISVKVFLLSFTEVMDSTDTSAYEEGAVLSYFDDVESSKRIGYFDGTATAWWFRSPRIITFTTLGKQYVWASTSSGTSGIATVTDAKGIRPALVLPSDSAYIDENNNVIV